jgi:hypothetical protein
MAETRPVDSGRGVALPIVGEETRPQASEDRRTVEVAASMGLETSTSTRVYQPKEFGKQESTPGYGTTATSFINSRAVLRGATLNWDKERLVSGKLDQYQKIGGEPLTLTTKTGDRISAFHFDVKNFHQEIEKMGGKATSLEVQLNHPFFERAQPVNVKIGTGEKSADGVRIPYSAELESEFKNPGDFLKFCQKMGYDIYWENGMQPFETASWWHFNSMKQNLILVSKFDTSLLKTGIQPNSIQIETAPEFGMSFTFFSHEPLRSKAYVFDEAHAENASNLFCGALNGGKGLKIENSSWNMISYEGKVYFLENPAVEQAMNFMEMKDLKGLGSITLSSRPIIQPKLDAERATVVLSMNQTNSFASYSHEILTFLFAGVNVLAYDNAGKGLSEGSNSEQGMTEAIRSAGQYLREEKGLRQNQILFKGQCAGGLPSSEAAKMFPASHVWVDQAPNTFSGTAKGIALQKAKEASEDTNDSSWLKTFSGIIPYVAPLVSSVASLALPSYNVVDNLKENHGIQIYTIGVPDEKGYGGDEMVPSWERDEIEKAVRLNPMGHYLTITGGTHVTDWWLDPGVAKSVDKIFKRFSLSASLFPETPKTPEQVFEAYTQKPYQADSLTATEKSVLAVFEAVENEDFAAIDKIMNWEDAVTPWHSLGLRDFLSTTDHERLLNDAISFSKTLGHQAFTERLMLAKKNFTI